MSTKKPLYERLLEELLRLYPERIRQRYGDDLKRAYRRGRSAQEAPIGLCELLRAAADTVWHGVAARLGERKRLEPATAYGRPRGFSRRVDLGGTVADLRYAWRQLRRHKTFTTVALLALGLGIGANVAVFSVVDGVYLHGLPYRDVDRLVMLWEDQSTRGGTARSPVASANFLDWQERTHSFTALAALRNESRRLTGLDEPVVPLTHLVTPNYFDLLGVRPLEGRFFSPEDGQRRDTVVISYGLWQGALGGDSEIIGQKLELSDETFTVVGVVDPSFYSHHLFPTQPDLWLPTDFEDESTLRDMRQLIVFGHLSSGVTRERAQQELTTITAQLAAEHPETNADWGALVEPLRENVVGSLRQTFLLLLGAVGLVLLIACSNVANLFLARTTHRGREVALRTALGASGWRVARQLLVEGMLLSVLGGGVAVLLALTVVPTLTHLIPQGAGVPFVDQIEVNGRVLLFSLGLSLFCGLLFGLLPARQGMLLGLAPTLRTHDRSTGGRHRRREGALLIAAEVALTVVVVVAAGLMVQSFVELRAFDPGFDADNLLTLRTSIRGDGFSDPASRVKHFADLEARLSSHAGIESVGSASFLPPLTPRFVVRFSSPAIAEVIGQEPRAIPRSVTRGYFETMRIPLVAGRLFDRRDQADSMPVVVINEVLARRFFADTDPLAQTLTLSPDARPDLGPGIERQIVGVVGNVLTGGADPRPEPAFYLVHTQAPFAIMNVVLRTSVEPTSVARVAEREMWSSSGDVNVYGQQTLEQAVADTQWRTAFSTRLLSSFALLALLLGAAGIYAVISHSVAQRTSEIGVRMTFGARPADVLRLTLRTGLWPALLGIAVGSFLALFVTRTLRGLLLGVTTTDIPTYLAVGATLVVVALLASLLPAVRAARIDPTEALRSE